MIYRLQELFKKNSFLNFATKSAEFVDEEIILIAFSEYFSLNISIADSKEFVLFKYEYNNKFPTTC